MTFKKSFMANLKNRPWMIAMTVLITLVECVFIPAMYFGSERIRQMSMGLSGEKLTLAMQKSAGGWFGGSLVLGAMGILLLAAIIGIQAFSYLYKTNSVDFYDSQPVSFRGRFLTNYFNGLLLFAVVYAGGTALEMIVARLSGGGSLVFDLALLERYVWFVALFWGTYSIAVLAAVLSGNTFIAFLMGCFLSGAEFLCRFVINSCINVYFTTVNWQTDSPFFPESLPLTHYIRYAGNFMLGNADFVKTVQGHTTETLKGLAACAGIVLVATVLAYIAYMRRPRETAGKGLCFSFVESIVKITVGICGGTLAGMTADGIFASRYHYSPVVCLIIVVVVLLIGVIAEWIFNFNIAKSFRRGWQIPVCVVAAMALLVVFKQDLVGYDQYLPAPDTVASCAFYPEEKYSYTALFSEDMMNDETTEDYLEQYLVLKNVEAVEKVAAEGMKLQREYGTAYADYEYAYDKLPEELKNTWSAIVLYRLNDGRKVYRTIRLPYDVDRGAMDAVLGTEAYRQEYFNTKQMPKALKRNMKDYPRGDLTIYYNNTAGLGSNTDKASYAEIQKLVKAYRKDLKQYDFTYTQQHDCIGVVEVSYEAQGEYWMRKSQSYPVFDSYNHTIKKLKKLGIYEEPLPDPDKVEFVGVQYVTYSENDMGSEEPNTEEIPPVIYRDTKQMEQIFGALDVAYYGEWKQTPYEEEYYSATVVKHGEMENKEYAGNETAYLNSGLGTSYTILTKKLPEFVKQDFHKN